MPSPTLGIEEEFLLVDARDGRLRHDAERVLAKAAEAEDEGLEHELRTAMLETGSAVCRDLDTAGKELERRRSCLVAAADGAGAHVLATATHPFADPEPVPVTDDDRYTQMAEEFGALTYDTLVCGCHVHVAVPDRETGVHVVDRIRPWLAVVLAISGNSPYWRGNDTGYASWRAQVWKRWPTAGPCEVFGSLQAYEELSADLQATGVALDNRMLYYDARLSEHYPTVETRVADVCLDTEDAVLVAALVRGLVTTALADQGPPLAVPAAVLRAASWSASRHGLDAALVDPVARAARPAQEVVMALLEHVRPALDGAGDSARVLEGLERLRDRGTGAQQQRAAFARGGSAAVVQAVRLR